MEEDQGIGGRNDNQKVWEAMNVAACCGNYRRGEDPIIFCRLQVEVCVHVRTAEALFETLPDVSSFDQLLDESGAETSAIEPST